MKNRNLNLLLSGQLVSQVGDKCYMLALSLLVLETTGSAGKMGIVLFAGMLPTVVTGFFAGVVVDRVNRKVIIVMMDFFRSVIVLAVSLLYAYGFLGFGMIIVSQVLLSLCAALFNPAIPSVIPMIVEPDQLTRANAKTRFVSGISSISGPFMGGILVSMYGYGMVFFINAFSYAASAVFESFMAIPPTHRGHGETFRTALKKGYHYIHSDRKLLIILFMVFLIHFFIGSIEVAIPVISASIPGNGPVTMGYIQAAFGTGAVIMAMVLSYSGIDGREARSLFSSVAGMGVILLLIGISGSAGFSTAVFLVLFFFFGLSVILAGTGFQSLVQKISSVEMLGRVFGIAGSVGNFSIPFAMLVYGFLLDRFSCSLILRISGAVILLITLVFARTYQKQK